MYHLTLRGKVYQFRMRVPRDLLIHYEIPEIKHTLKTKDYSKAKLKAALRTAELEAEFANLRAGIPKRDDTPRALTPELITAICSQWESHNLFHDDKEREAGFEYGEIGEEIEERLERLREYEEVLRLAVGRGEHKIVEPALRDHLRYIGINVSPSDPLYGKLCLAFARTAARTAAKQLQRAEGIEVPTPEALPIDSRAAPIDELPTSSTKPSNAPLFDEVIKGFLTTYAKGKNTAMYRKHQPVLMMLLEVIGNKPVTELRQADLNGFFNLLGRLPPRWRDECRKRKMTVRQLAELDHPLTLSPKTFEDTYLASVRPFLKAAKKDWQDQGFPTTLTTEGQQYQGDRKEGENKQRPFRQAELKRLFEGPEMQSYAADPALAHCYWLPHIGLYTGARVNEICQLNPQTDILQDEESGIWYFWITDETEGHENIAKSTKNDVSRRRTPIHSRLLELGILAYVASVKKQGETLLFPLWKPVRKKASGKAEKWFVNLLRDIDLRDETIGARLVGMHAFRFTLENKGANTKGLPWPIDHITGHAIPQTSKVSRGYKGELSLPNKQEIIEAIQFDLDFIKPLTPG